MRIPAIFFGFTVGGFAALASWACGCGAVMCMVYYAIAGNLIMFAADFGLEYMALRQPDDTHDDFLAGEFSSYIG